MRMYELIGRGIAAARQRNGWTQEQAARAFRSCGLTAWRTSTVGSLEAGLRRPRLDEVLLMCAALNVSLADLIVDAAEPVELGDGAQLGTSVIRGMLARPIRELDELDDVDAESPGGAVWFPRDELIAKAVARDWAEREHLKPSFRLLRQWGKDHGLRPRNWADLGAVGMPTDTERHAARRLGVRPPEVRYAAEVLWKRGFEEERDVRVGDVDKLEPRSRQARRGLVTREMLAELRRMLDEALGTAGSQGTPAQQPVVAAIVTSRRGVLIGRRNDRTPPWTFIAGERELGEHPADTIMREVKEEAALEIRPGEVIGERDHPATGRRMIYVSARPVRGMKLALGDETELAEVRWASLSEAEQLMPDMFGPVHDFLVRTLPNGTTNR